MFSTPDNDRCGGTAIGRECQALYPAARLRVVCSSDDPAGGVARFDLHIDAALQPVDEQVRPPSGGKFERESPGCRRG